MCGPNCNLCGDLHPYGLMILKTATCLPQGGLQEVFVASNLLVTFGKQEAVGILNPALWPLAKR